MSWFWVTDNLENVLPDGGSLSAGLFVSVDSMLSTAVSNTTLEPNLIQEAQIQSQNQKLSELNVNGFGIRNLISTSYSSCSIDVGNGLQVINETGVVTNNVNKLKFNENLLVVSEIQNQSITANIETTSLVADSNITPSMLAVKQGANWVMANWEQFASWLGSTGGLPVGTVTVNGAAVTVNGDYATVN